MSKKIHRSFHFNFLLNSRSSSKPKRFSCTFLSIETLHDFQLKLREHNTSIFESRDGLQSLGIRSHIGFVFRLRIAHQTEKGFQRTFGRIRWHVCEAELPPQHQTVVRKRPERRMLSSSAVVLLDRSLK